MRSNCSHLGSRHLAIEPGRVRYSVVKGKAAGRSTMPGLHGCKECCVGCQLRRCCRHCGPHNPTSDLYPHLCEHCHTLFYDGKMTLQDVEFAVFRSYTCMPRSWNEPPMPVAVSALWSRSAGNEPWTAPYLVITTVFALGVFRLVW